LDPKKDYELSIENCVAYVAEFQLSNFMGRFCIATYATGLHRIL